MTKTLIKIGNAGGYWGDDPTALERQVNGGRLDYISMDFLAEITMSILQKQRAKEANAGYAKDFLAMLESVLKKILSDKTCIITNAGGVNPEACAQAISALAKKLGLAPKIAVVYGDDILQNIDQLHGPKCAFANMETGEDFGTVRKRIQAANVYFGALPVIEALKFGPDIIITGRVTDTGITLAPMVHEFGWALDDWDKLAAGIIAGHMIECGTQVTGGNFTDWQSVKTYNNIGYPIVEVSADATFVLTKHVGSGGLVSFDTVREQVFYEMGNPHAYITPDVVADFSTIKLAQKTQDRVHVSGIKGYEPTPLYKVSMAYSDGYKAVGSILISGPNARTKAEKFADIFWHRVGKDFVATETEYFGWNATQRSLGGAEDGPEILLRLGARSEDQDKLRKFAKMIPALILGGPPGVAVTGGNAKAQEVVSYWPALMPKTLVHPKIALYQDGLKNIKTIDQTSAGNFKETAKKGEVQIAKSPSAPIKKVLGEGLLQGTLALSEICLGRSGDKGDTCNIGVLARGPEAYEFLKKLLTAQKVKDYFQELCLGQVIRYELEELLGFNFLLESSLGGGGTETMRSDAQGKTFAQALLRQKTLIPDAVLRAAAKYNADRGQRH